MNQEQVKQILLDIRDTDQYFSVIFTGKSSKKVDGLYYPQRHEILIHNKNMHDDNEIMYTAIHEYAHHLHFCSTKKPTTNRTHTREFWNLFHELLETAEKKSIFKNVFKTNDEFISLTQTLKEKFISKNGELMREFGSLLCKAVELCNEHHVSFEDYVDRELGLHRTTAKNLISVFKKDINPSIGFENMTTVARIRDESKRADAEKAFINGNSPDRVRHEFLSPPKPDDPQLRLEAERIRLQKTINTLQKKLESIEAELQHMEHQ